MRFFLGLAILLTSSLALSSSLKVSACNLEGPLEQSLGCQMVEACVGSETSEVLCSAFMGHIYSESRQLEISDFKNAFFNYKDQVNNQTSRKSIVCLPGEKTKDQLSCVILEACVSHDFMKSLCSELMAKDQINKGSNTGSSKGSIEDLFTQYENIKVERLIAIKTYSSQYRSKESEE